jgi:hypothetical protein
MAKTKLSEYDSTAANNTDVDGINIAESCPPSGINNAIREVMAHLKDFQSGVSGDTFTNTSTLTSSGTLAVTGNFTLDGAAGTSGQVMLSAGTGTPTWGDAFVTGMIMMWSGTIATIPSGWALCDGTSGTPDLRNKMIVAADADDGGVAKSTVTGTASQSGGSKDAIVVEHTHTATVTDSGHSHPFGNNGNTGGYDAGGWGGPYILATGARGSNWRTDTESATTGITVANSTEGSSGTNANLPPYYALAFIMKL